MTITFRKRIVGIPEKRRSIELEILYQMHFSLISDDAFTKSYDHSNILEKHLIFVLPVTGLDVIEIYTGWMAISLKEFLDVVISFHKRIYILDLPIL